jgi:hypothetical protein
MVQPAEALAMLGLLERLKRFGTTTSTIVFDEDYCHSAGEEGGKVYEIKKGTTEIAFKFPDFAAFMHMYFFDNRYLAAELKSSVADRTGILCIQVIEDQAYLCTDRPGDDDCIILRAASLRPLQQHWGLRAFSRGVIGIGIYQPSITTFSVLWATRYSDTLTA